MACSFSGAKLLSSLVSRRGYSAVASQGSVSARSGTAPTRMAKAPEKAPRESEKAWIPDPVTGYYRPANREKEIDVAELRAMLLKQRIRSQ